MFPHGLFKPLLALFVLSQLAACASNSQTRTDADPLEEFNRAMFALNNDVDAILLRPAADIYDTVLPEPVNQSVSNFFRNLEDLPIAANNLLQGKPDDAASDVGRFLLNTLVGFVGFFDVASDYGLPKHNEDFGQTLGYWGLEPGPYLVLPLLGPSSLRDTAGLATNTGIETQQYRLVTDSNNIRAAAGTLNRIDQRAALLRSERILETAVTGDPYIFLRNAYLQRRATLVNDGELPEDMQINDDELFGTLE